MGLDMYLYKRSKPKEVAYWRKANMIHKWFDDHVAYGELENCREYPVTKDELIELKEICERILKSSKIVPGMVKTGERLVNGEWHPMYQEGEIIEEPSLAEELLPTQSGFFYGSTAYDTGYIEDLKVTIQQIDKVLEETDFDTEEIMYEAWW